MGRNLTDQVIIVTGASSGIGAATAVECARAGMHVVLNARREDRLKDVAANIKTIGRESEFVVGDVTKQGISEEMLDCAMNRFGRFDVVFANAGFGFDKSMLDVSEDEFREIFEVNFFAGVDLLQKSARRLISEKRPGHLLMCSSCLAKFTAPYHGPYCATKAAQNHICRAMRLELKQHGINVASVHPIGTMTEFFSVSAERSGKPDVVTTRGPGFLMQPPERVARAVVRCLRHPKPEVWTSFLIRFLAGLMTISPRLMDVLISQARPRRFE